MSGLAKPFVFLSLIAFVLAVVGGFWADAIFGVGAEAYSRACTNLALMAIAIAMVFTDSGTGTGS
jgi:hypothetical protein